MRQSQAYSLQGLLLAGFLAGCGFLVEFSGAFVAAALFFYLLATYRNPRAFFYSITCAIPILILMAYDYSLFGNPFSTPYQHLAGHSYQAIVNEGIAGISFPRLDRFVGSLLSPERGLLLFSPILVLGYISLLQNSSRKVQFNAEIWLFRAITCVTFLYVSSFAGWNAGGAFGLRYAMFGLVFMFLPAAFIIDQVPFSFSIGITIVSILINWAGVQRGFAENYYQHLQSLITQGPTMQSLVSIQTHLTGSSGLLKWIVAQQGWISISLVCIVLLICFTIWKFPQLDAK